MQKNIVEEKSVNMCRENLIIKENSSLSSHGLKPRGFSRSFLDKAFNSYLIAKIVDTKESLKANFLTLIYGISNYE